MMDPFCIFIVMFHIEYKRIHKLLQRTTYNCVEFEQPKFLRVIKKIAFVAFQAGKETLLSLFLCLELQVEIFLLTCTICYYLLLYCQSLWVIFQIFRTLKNKSRFSEHCKTRSWLRYLTTLMLMFFKTLCHKMAILMFCSIVCFNQFC